MNKKKIEKVAVVGSREYRYMMDVESYVAALEDVVIVSGGARGVDIRAEKTALREDVDLDILIFPPQYIKYGFRAPLMRNHQIVDAADRVVAFWDGANASGTVHTINYALRKRKPLLVFRRDEVGQLFVSTDMKSWIQRSKENVG